MKSFFYLEKTSIKIKKKSSNIITITNMTDKNPIKLYYLNDIGSYNVLSANLSYMTINYPKNPY